MRTDLDAVRAPGTPPRGRQVAVLRRAPDHRSERERSGRAGEVATVDREHGAGDVARFVRREVDAAPRNVLGDAEVGQGNAALEPVAHGGIRQQGLDRLAALDQARGDRVHPDAATRVSHRHRPRERVHRTLGRRVGIHARRALGRHPGRDVDDRAAAGRGHLRDRVLAAPDQAPEIRGQRLVEDVVGQLGDAGVAAIGQAGQVRRRRVVDERGEAPESLDGRPHGAHDVALPADVGRHEGGGAAGGGDLRRQRLAGGDGPSSQHDPSAFACEHSRDRAADALRGARDEGRLAIESHHPRRLSAEAPGSVKETGRRVREQRRRRRSW